MTSRPTTYFAAVLLFCIAFLLQVKFGGNGIGLENAVFVMLIVLAFVLDIFSVAFISILAAWLLNWQLAFSWELALLLGVPALLVFLRDISPSSFLVGCAVAVAVGVSLWYAAADVRFVTDFAPAVAQEVAFGLLWAAIFLLPVRALSQHSFVP